MCDVENALPISARRTLRETIAQTTSPLIHSLPKVELHIHIEGTLTPALKWHFSQRNNRPLYHPRTGVQFTSLTELQDSHDTMKPSGDRMNNEEETLSFFEAYYGGFEVLRTREDYFDLAMHYFERAAGANVRYAEVFFDPQGHTRTGTSWNTMMGGFRAASEKAEKELNVSLPCLNTSCNRTYNYTGQIIMDPLSPPRRVARIGNGTLPRRPALPRHDQRHRPRLKRRQPPTVTLPRSVRPRKS